MSKDENDILFVSAESADWIASVALSRALYGGSDAMRAMGKTFLPSGASEGEVEYSQRLEESFLFPAYKKVTELLSGQVFKTDVRFMKDVPVLFEEIYNQPSTAKLNLTAFAKKCFEMSLVDGGKHILVDADKDGGRPWFRAISPESISVAIFGSDGKLSVLKIDEVYEKQLGRFGTEPLKQVRVFETTESKCYWELWQQLEAGTEVELIDSGYLEIDYIPIALFGGEVYPVPLLCDLADLALAHWQSNSRQTNVLSIGRTPLLFAKMMNFPLDPETGRPMIESSPKRFFIGNDGDSDMKWVELEGKSVESGFLHLEKIENAMESYGANLFYRENQTATGKAIDSTGAYSTLESWALTLQAMLQEGCEIAGDMVREKFPEDVVAVEREYLGWSQTEGVRKMLAELVKGKALSPESMFKAGKRYVQPLENVEWDDEKKRISEQGAQSIIETTGELTNA